MVNSCDAAVAELEGRLRKVGALGTSVCMPCDKLGLLKRRESTNCDMNATTGKITSAQGKVCCYCQ